MLSYASAAHGDARERSSRSAHARDRTHAHALSTEGYTTISTQTRHAHLKTHARQSQAPIKADRHTRTKRAHARARELHMREGEATDNGAVQCCSRAKTQPTKEGSVGTRTTPHKAHHRQTHSAARNALLLQHHHAGREPTETCFNAHPRRRFHEGRARCEPPNGHSPTRTAPPANRGEACRAGAAAGRSHSNRGFRLAVHIVEPHRPLAHCPRERSAQIERPMPGVLLGAPGVGRGRCTTRTHARAAPQGGRQHAAEARTQQHPTRRTGRPNVQRRRRRERGGAHQHSRSPSRTVHMPHRSHASYWESLPINAPSNSTARSKARCARPAGAC